MEGIEGKVVAITGGSSGIGEATARRLAREGASVMLGARRTDRLARIVDEIAAAGGVAACVDLDVRECASVEAFVHHTIARFGRIDVLVANAGIMPLSPLSERRIADWTDTVDINLKGVLHGVYAALPAFRGQGGGHFVLITSISDRNVYPTGAVYAATKYAVRALAEGMRKELAAENIRTTVIAPGGTESELFDHVPDPALREAMKKNSTKLKPDTIAQAVSYAMVQPEEVGVNEIVVRHRTMTM